MSRRIVDYITRHHGARTQRLNVVFYTATRVVRHERDTIFRPPDDAKSRKKFRKKKLSLCSYSDGSWGAIVMMYNYTGRTRTFLQLQRITPLIPGQTRDTCFSSYKSRPSVSKGRSSISLLCMYT